MTDTALRLDREEPGFDLSIVALTAALVGIGIVAVFSASFAKAAASSMDSFYLVKRQTFAALLGAVAMVAVARLNLTRVRAGAYGILGLAVVVLVAVLGLGREINGAHRWFQIGFFHLQPSEFAKLALLIATARYVLDNPRQMKAMKGLLGPILAAVAFAFLVVIEPDLGTAVVLVLLAFLMYHFGGAKLRHLAVYAAVGMLLISIAILAEPYRRERVISWVHPHTTALGSGYQLRHSVIALGAGGPIGRGLGESREKYSYLPAAETDCIFAIVGEETGLIGTWGLLALFGLLLWRGMATAARAADPYHSLLGAGVTAMLLNVAVVTGLMPTKGQPLPFVSYGGSSLIFSMAAVGLLLNISRQPKRAASGRALRNGAPGTRRAFMTTAAAQAGVTSGE
jgi:cell division protein FtsW